MSCRSKHLAEMRYAVTHQCSLPEARRQIARLDWLAVANLRDQPRTIHCFTLQPATITETDQQARRRTHYGYDD